MSPEDADAVSRHLEDARTALVAVEQIARDGGVPDRYRQQVTDSRLGVTQLVGRLHEIEVDR